MLRCLSGMIGYQISAVDGEIGRIQDFLFDDFQWVVRYIVVDAGSLLSRKRVLISPAMAGRPQWKEQVLPVALTAEQVKASPDVETDKPVSRQRECAVAMACGSPISWTPDAVAPAPLMPTHPALADTAGADSHLRSMQHVLGYGIHASDGDLGHVYDVIVEDDRWTIRYMVVDTRAWLPGRKVLIAARWIEEITWATRKVKLDLTRKGIKRSLEYDPATPINCEYELQLYDYYGRPKYWE